MDIQRTTNLGTAISLLNYMQSSNTKYNDLAEQASSGYRVRKPSDDPFASKSILNINTKLAQLTSYLDNMTSAQTELNTLDGTLSSVTDIIQKATDLATQAANGTYANDDLDNIKTQVDEIIRSLIDLANTSYDGNYIFSGTATATKPYTLTTDADGNIMDIIYNGTPSTDVYQRNVVISDGVSITINTTGDQVFGFYSAAIADDPLTIPDETKAEVANGLFGTLMQISNALGKYNQETVSSCIDKLNNSLNNVSAIRTKFASVSNRFKLTESSINSALTNLKSYKSDLKDADLSQVMSDLAIQETGLRASYQVFAQVNRLSLLNYL